MSWPLFRSPVGHRQVKFLDESADGTRCWGCLACDLVRIADRYQVKEYTEWAQQEVQSDLLALLDSSFRYLTCLECDWSGDVEDAIIAWQDTGQRVWCPRCGQVFPVGVIVD